MAEHSSDTSESNPRVYRWYHCWPVVVFLAACVGVFHWGSTFYSVWTQGIISGMLLGLGCFISAIGGLWSRCWLCGIWFAAAIAAGTVFCFMAVEMELNDQLRNYAGFFIAPIFVLGISVPTLVARVLWGWQLERPNSFSEQHAALGMEETLLGTGVVASFLILLRIPQTVWEMPIVEFYGTMGVSFVVLCSVSLVAAAPAVWGVFRSQSWTGRILIPVAVPFSVAALVMLLADTAAGSTNLREASISAFAAGFTASLCCLSGLFAVYFSGFRLTDRTMRHPPSTAVHAKERRIHRRWVAGTMLVAIISTAVLARIQVHRQTAESQSVDLSRQLKPSGGFVTLEERKIIRLGLGSDADDRSLDQLVDYRYLKHLSLADSGITDAGVARLVEVRPQLLSLDLAGTAISREALKSLLELPNLTTISLARTNLSIKDINVLGSNRKRWKELDISGMQLTDADVEALEVSANSLILRDNEISDAGLSLMAYRELQRCDLSGNPIDGSGLKDLPRLSNLVLEDVPITDAAFANLSAAGYSVSTLAIRDTLLTDAALPSLATISTGDLRLGPGKFTEQGFATASLAVSSLRLNIPDFTGTFLEGKWVRDLSYLDLSRSGITDANLSKLTRINSLYCLNLDSTNVTDAALPHIAKANPLIRLDLRNTRITADGLAGSEIICQRIYLGLDQFSPQEIKRIRATKNVVIGETFPQNVFE